MVFHAAAENGIAVLVLFDKAVFVVIAYNVVCIYFAVGGVCGLFKRMLKQKRLHGFRFIPFIQRERDCRFAVPPHAVPGALALPGHDPEFGDGGLMPVFDLAQDRFEILAD
jgi:hypothetical protein